MRNRALVITCAAASAVLATLAAPASGASTATRPAAVTGLAAFQKQGPVTLSWTNPRDIDRDVVRLARGTKAPATPSDGRAVPLTHPVTSHVVLAHLADGARYSVSLWTKRDGHFSHRVATSFTTKWFRSAPAGPGTLAGHVFDTSGDPLANAIIWVVDYATFSNAHIARTDSSGAFRMDVPRGSYFIAAIGSNAVGGTSDRTGYVPGFRETPVHTGQTALRFTLADGGALTGTVTDSQGAPLHGVQVGLIDAPAYLTVSESGLEALLNGPVAIDRTDGHGRYRFTGLPSGAFVPCFATRGAKGGATDARGYVSRCDNHSAGIAARTLTTTAQVALAPAPRVAHTAFGSVAGTVTGSTGKPVDNVRVVTFNSRTGDTGADTRTNSRGHFAVHRLAPGRWYVCADRSNAQPCRRVRVVAKHTASVALHFPRIGSLSGVVRGPSGVRLANGEVIAEHESKNSYEGFGVMTDQHGQFNLGGMTPGMWKVCFAGGASSADRTGARSGCIAKKIKVYNGRDRIGADRTLAPGGAVAGTVTDSNGDPVSGAGVDVYRRRAGFGDFGTAITTNSHGVFEAAGLDPGKYHVCAEVDYESGGSLARCAADQVVVVAKRVVRGIALALPADASLTTTVTDDSGNPLSGVDVAVIGACRPNQYCEAQPVFSKGVGVNAVASAVTDGSGVVTFHGLQPGRYTACALAYYAASATISVPTTGYADECAGKTFDLHVTRGGNPTTTLALEPAAAVTGLVHNAAGAGLAAVRVQVAGAAASDYTSGAGIRGALLPSPDDGLLTDAHGRYTVRSIAPGTRKVCAVPPADLKVRRGCLTGPVQLTTGTVTQAPVLELAAAQGSARAAVRAARTARVAAAMPLSFLQPRNRFLPASDRMPVISSSGMPEFRVLSRR